MTSRRLVSASAAIARIERVVSCLLAAALVVLILLNVATRAFDVALFWVDELAVYLMIWMALIGGSYLLHERRHVAVTLLSAVLSDVYRKYLAVLADVLVLLFAAGLFAMSVAWYDPVGIAQYGFNAAEYAAGTYNFIYQEPTTTLGVQKYFIWLVVPVVSITMTLHALANLAKDLSHEELG